jgi:hypothetical protein
MNNAAKLRSIKIAHTIVWAMFAGSIIAIPVCAWAGRFATAFFLIGLVFVECIVLAVNRMRCPLTDVAARYTKDRNDNFDIYLPLWLARWNKHVFGWLYLAGIAATAYFWLVSMPR